MEEPKNDFKKAIKNGVNVFLDFMISWRIELLMALVVIVASIINGFNYYKFKDLETGDLGIIMALIPAIITFCSLFISISELEVYGIRRINLNRFKPKDEYDFLNKAILVIVLFAIRALAKVINLELLLIVIEFFSLYVAFEFVMTEIRYFEITPKKIAKLVKKNYFPFSAQRNSFDPRYLHDYIIGVLLSKGWAKAIFEELFEKGNEVSLIGTLYSHLGDIIDLRMKATEKSDDPYSGKIGSIEFIANMRKNIKYLMAQRILLDDSMDDQEKLIQFEAALLENLNEFCESSDYLSKEILGNDLILWNAFFEPDVMFGEDVPKSIYFKTLYLSAVQFHLFFNRFDEKHTSLVIEDISPLNDGDTYSIDQPLLFYGAFLLNEFTKNKNISTSMLNILRNKQFASRVEQEIRKLGDLLEVAFGDYLFAFHQQEFLERDSSVLPFSEFLLLFLTLLRMAILLERNPLSAENLDYLADLCAEYIPSFAPTFTSSKHFVKNFQKLFSSINLTRKNINSLAKKDNDFFSLYKKKKDDNQKAKTGFIQYAKSNLNKFKYYKSLSKSNWNAVISRTDAYFDFINAEESAIDRFFQRLEISLAEQLSKARNQHNYSKLSNMEFYKRVSKGGGTLYYPENDRKATKLGPMKKHPRLQVIPTSRLKSPIYIESDAIKADLLIEDISIAPVYYPFEYQQYVAEGSETYGLNKLNENKVTVRYKLYLDVDSERIFFLSKK